MHNPQAQLSPYTDWEDYQAGMYRPRHDAEHVEMAIGVLSNPNRFADSLHDAAEAWPIAASHHLSDFCKNHQPWCGRLACAFEVDATIKETTAAWGFLHAPQQIRANAVADSFTYQWRALHLKGQLSWV